MALEALASLSLASSVVQFVDFTSKLISKGNKYYKSIDGTLEEHTKLKHISENLRELSKGLQQSSRPFERARGLSVEEKALNGVAMDCRAVGEEFSAMINKLKLPDKRTRWKSFRHAVKSNWSREAIQAMLFRLRILREDLAIHLLVVNKQQLCFQTSLEELHDRTERRILKAIPVTSFEDMNIRNSMPRGLHNAWRIEHAHEIENLENNLSSIAADKQREKVHDMVLHSLYFPQIRDRYESVAVAHAKTIQWIFKTKSDVAVPCDSFVSWLRDDSDSSGLYWVTGKPGSGKSTLMKFLFNDPRTKRHLQHWAKPFEPVFASCFFWNPGSEIQKSLRELTQSAAPWCWQSYELGARQLPPWSNTELLKALRRIFDESKNSTRLVIFLDGLDEFDGNDAARLKVIEIFKDITKLQHVKVCVSSRPWPIFEDAFQGQPSLLLQQLTYNDITSYVRTELEENPRFQRLVDNEPQRCSEFIANIVDKASGVFLWVYLVVRSLLEGLRNEDGVTDLQIRLCHVAFRSRRLFPSYHWQP